MRSIWAPRRATEATGQQLVATGAAGAYGVDPVDGERGWVPVGPGTSGGWRREMPAWSLEKARAYSVAAYRANPMARAIVDTYTAFCVGDSGVSPMVSSPLVRPVVDRFWNDPANRLGALQELLFRSWLLNGERCDEMMVGATTGVVGLSPIDPSRVAGVEVRNGNPLWPDLLMIQGHDRPFQVIRPDPVSGLRTGDVLWHTGWRASEFDSRGMPFLTTILDQIEDYDQVLSNLIDRTALARYLVWDVTVNGTQDDVDGWVKARGGLHMPPSGTVEVHNEAVTWKPQTANSGAAEDTQTMSAVLTTVAGGSGLAKTWLADAEGANRATALSMAEPVRRRVGSVQRQWLEYMSEMCRFVVDRAVAAGRIPAMVPVLDASGTQTGEVPAAETVRVDGPAIAAADSTIQATVMLNLSTALGNLVDKAIITPAAAQVAAQKAWEQFVGQPFRVELLPTDGTADPAAVAEAIADGATRRLRAL